ncbi:IclR family transcriptional regulator [Cupriavidus sp. 30B13]|uniref:IclR family transcriptional regulator n=1 Tax=Cupriavidus sp. 30B13 TaxID=3384241 RepID=UPI003B8F1A2F
MTQTPGDDERGNGIQVIARAARILDVLGGSSAGMSLGEIARAVDLPRSTVQRIVNALGTEELVRAERSDGVRLGPALLRLVGRQHTDVVAVVTPHLQALSEEVGETVVLTRISGQQLVFVHVIVAERELRVVPRVGTNLPLHSTCTGRALLAMSTDEEVVAMLGDNYERVTPHTLHTSAALLRELRKVRKDGYAVDREETAIGISAVAVAIDTILGRYAVSVVVPSARFEGQQARISKQLLKCKDILHGEIGRLSAGR